MSWIRLQNRRALRLAPAVLAIGAFVIVSCSRSSVCVQETQAYQEHLNSLRGQLGLAPVRLIGRGTGSAAEHPEFVSGQRDAEEIGGSPSDIFFHPNYSMNCKFPPYRVDGALGQQDIKERPNPLPWFCDVSPQKKYFTLEPQPQRNDWNSRLFLESVGALMIQAKGDSYHEEFWGSGFLMGDYLFATSCHALEPLVKQGTDGHLETPDYNLFVDFKPGWKPYPSSGEQFKVTKIDCSDQPGLDVALLSLEQSKSTPPAVALYLDDLSLIQNDVAALVGYVDLRHPMDKITSEMYDFFVPTYGSSDDYGYWKFAMLDNVYDVKHCNDGLDLLLDSADTSVGSSGSLVLDPFLQIDSPEPKHASVAIGLHKCCAAYFGEEKSTGPQPEMPCARMLRTRFNQDVSTVSILNDPRLCHILKEYHAKVVKSDGSPAEFPPQCTSQDHF